LFFAGERGRNRTRDYNFGYPSRGGREFLSREVAWHEFEAAAAKLNVNALLLRERRLCLFQFGNADCERRFLTRHISRHATFGLPNFVRYCLKHTSRQSCSVYGAFMSKVWPFVAERVIPLKEL
jgi:hypothetical protein